jgi:hypothetical protein
LSGVIGTSFVAAGYEEPLPAPIMDLARVYIVQRAVRAFVVDVAPPSAIELHRHEADEGSRSDERQESCPIPQPLPDVSGACGVSSPRTVSGVRASLALTRRFSPDADGSVCSTLFQDMDTHFLWEYPMKCHTNAEFVRALDGYPNALSAPSSVLNFSSPMPSATLSLWRGS